MCSPSLWKGSFLDVDARPTVFTAGETSGLCALHQFSRDVRISSLSLTFSTPTAMTRVGTSLQSYCPESSQRLDVQFVVSSKLGLFSGITLRRVCSTVPALGLASPVRVVCHVRPSLPQTKPLRLTSAGSSSASFSPGGSPSTE